MPRWAGADALIGHDDTDARTLLAELLGRLALVPVPVTTGADLLAAALDHRPVLVVLAVDLERPSGYEVCRDLRERFGDDLPVVFVAGPTSASRDEIAGLLLGADEYFDHPLRVTTFVARVRRLLVRTAARLSVAPGTPAASLTRRELEVLSLLADGERSGQIAEILGVSRKTAQTHIEHILGKLGAHSQAQAVATAMRSGLVSADGAGAP
jgi:DNA-binding NarL/FixJ family response regulator